MKFGSPAKFRETVRDTAIIGKFDLSFVKNDGDRVTVVCKAKCRWRIHASEIGEDKSFQIKTFNDTHNCTGVRHNSQLTYSYLAKHYTEKIMADLNCSLKGFVQIVESEFNVDATKQKVARAKKLALLMIVGDYSKQFGRTRDYCALILETNRRIVANVKTIPYSDDGTSFYRLFYSLEAMWKGFLEGCRPLIGLDGCFLKGPYGGHLLCAVGRDGFYPIAIGCVKAECKDYWEWLLDELMALVSNYQKYTFISNRQKGLLEVFEHKYPGADIRFCIKHMHDNFRQKYKGRILRNIFWNTSTAYTRFDFVLHIYIGKAREKPLIYMFEKIRKQLMLRYQNNIEMMDKVKGLLCPKIKEKLDKISEDVRRLRYWDITGIPCKHAVAAILDRRFDPELFVHPSYYRETYLKSYGYVITPVSLKNLKREVGTAPILPPPHRTRPGRPKKIRKIGLDESKSKGSVVKRLKMRCIKCLVLGYNVRTYKALEQAIRQPKGKGGRPRIVRGTGGVGGGRDETVAGMSARNSTTEGRRSANRGGGKTNRSGWQNVHIGDGGRPARGGSSGGTTTRAGSSGGIAAKGVGSGGLAGRGGGSGGIAGRGGSSAGRGGGSGGRAGNRPVVFHSEIVWSKKTFGFPDRGLGLLIGHTVATILGFK
ncbi:uncharacterized protein LOC132277932 [Cornus florida]|uniref:uncharacterized protein LOC132277932 n=1 Tax=Cornus florida TaxID=4283 RepID=UPI0028990A94|nr:uncharacterized protein LOC132277932 [Cornus florida]